jgi:hypothetical protein
LDLILDLNIDVNPESTLSLDFQNLFAALNPTPAEVETNNSGDIHIPTGLLLSPSSIDLIASIFFVAHKYI